MTHKEHLLSIMEVFKDTYSLNIDETPGGLDFKVLKGEEFVCRVRYDTNTDDRYGNFIKQIFVIGLNAAGKKPKSFQSLKQSPPEPGQLILVTDGDNAEAVIYTPECFKKPKALDKYDTPNFTINDYGLQWLPLELPKLEIACTYTADDKFPLSGKYAYHYFRDIPSGYFLWLKQQTWFLQNRSPKYLGVLNYIKTIEEDAQVEKGIEIGKMRRI